MSCAVSVQELSIFYVSYPLSILHNPLSIKERNEIKFEFRKKAKERMPIIKLYTGLALRRLKKISNIKPFSSLFFRFYGFEWNMVQLGTV